MSNDYDNVYWQVTFGSDSVDSRRVCRNISVVFDDVVEDVEEFLVSVSSLTSNVQIMESNASIIIQDSSSKYFYYKA